MKEARRVRRGRPVAALGLVLIAIFGLAEPAGAHAGFLSASPGPGVGVPQPPNAVVVRFSEPLNLNLSSIGIINRSDRYVGTGPTLEVVGDDGAMQRKLGFVPPGEYVVRWTTVSSVDGHTLHGSYRFGVGAAASDAQTVAATPASSEGPLGVAGRFMLLAGLTLWAGRLVLGARAARAGARPQLLRAVQWAAPAAVFAGSLAVAMASALGATGSLRQLPAVFASQSGAWRAVTLAAGGAGAILSWRGNSHWPRLVLAAAAAAVVAEASAGHAASTSLPVLAIPMLASHVVAVGTWLFAIAAALTATRVSVALAKLSRPAVIAAAAAGVTGAFNTVLELSKPDDLIGTGYGQAVVVKAGIFAVMVGGGLVHRGARRRRQPEPRLRRPLGAEASAAVIALAAAALLAGFPNPPGEAAGEQLGGLTQQLVALTKQDALSLAGSSGPFVVGVTVVPPRPGPVRIQLQTVGVEPGDGLRDASILATAPNQPEVAVKLRSCGLGCFTADTRIPGPATWAFGIEVTTNHGPIELTVSAPLPAPPGAETMGRALARMGGLSSATMTEQLRSTSGSPAVEATYRFRAPDAFAYSVNGTERVTVGDRVYARDSGGTWTTEKKGGQFSWPANYFSAFWGPGNAARVIGQDIVNGRSTDIVAFVRPELPAWFRIWVDTDNGIVHREEMRAQAHLMDHQWAGFDQPVDIPTPP